MRKFTLLFISIITFAGAFAQTINKKYLFEEFSTEACPQCPATATYLHGIQANDPKLIFMTHHAGFGTDKFTIPENNAMLPMYGGSTWAPAGMIDRFFFGAMDLDNYGGLDKGPVLWPRSPYGKTIIDKRKNDSPTTNVSVNVTGSYDATSKVLTATVSGNFTADYTGIGVSLWITEDNITSSTQASGGSNYIHHDVVRDVISGQWGDALTGTTNGTTYTKTFTYTVNSAWVLSNLHLVAFVSQIDADIKKRTIHNVEEVKLSTLTGVNGPAAENVSFKAYPNPSTGNVFVNISTAGQAQVSVKVYDVVGTLMSETNGNVAIAKQFELNLNDLPNGLYFVEVTSGNTKTTQKVTLNK